MQSIRFQPAPVDRLSADLRRTNTFRATGLATRANNREISRNLRTTAEAVSGRTHSWPGARLSGSTISGVWNRMASTQR